MSQCDATNLTNYYIINRVLIKIVNIKFGTALNNQRNQGGYDRFLINHNLPRATFLQQSLSMPYLVFCCIQSQIIEESLLYLHGCFELIECRRYCFNISIMCFCFDKSFAHLKLLEAAEEASEATLWCTTHDEGIMSQQLGIWLSLYTANIYILW